jgi:hypothetical protein
MKKLIAIVILTICAYLPAFSQNTDYSRSGKNGVWFEVRNDTYGFVKMDNTNIDGSRIVIDLVRVNFQ